MINISFNKNNFFNISKRYIRQRVVVSEAAYKRLNIENGLVAANWPPEELCGKESNPKSCRELMSHLRQKEMNHMESIRHFKMPDIRPGDLLEIRYELSRSQQTFSVFQGYCIAVRHRGNLNCTFVLKNTYDGIGVTQIVPWYNPRLLDVSVIKAGKNVLTIHNKPMTRDRRYLWINHRQHRRIGKMSQNAGRWNSRGLKTLEPTLRRRLAKLRKSYRKIRIVSGLPPYIWPGPYPQFKQRTRLIRAETHRQTVIHAWDHMRKRKFKEAQQLQKSRWGVYKILNNPPSIFEELPSYHPLKDNLPK
eukprot:GHVL01012489.1.p1 GENE.GHVL01012489.1~~GHVL01012489.1.p1  ORF type:complete len:305 (+),score=44.03 GHVL01012489.1:56-970(+)